ncbi:MAG: cyclase family protein [Gammaproteobacteria bacterium]|nr:cyclase family protein [Gammaproteobacteria bacterium]
MSFHGEFVIGGSRYRVDFAKALDIAIALDFSGTQPNHFGAAPATMEPMRAGGFVGDTAQGGSCNVPEIRLNPHCNGTHTESLAHIAHNAAPVHLALTQSLHPGVLVSLVPVASEACAEAYLPAHQPGDRLITRAALEQALADYADAQLKALVIRSLPNSRDKLGFRYGEDGFPPFLSLPAMAYLLERGVEHLLVDFPSVDKMYDEGYLEVHHRFWNIPERAHLAGPEALSHKSITELVFVPDTIADGFYLVELSIPAFLLDAAPSRPRLYALEIC